MQPLSQLDMTVKKIFLDTKVVQQLHDLYNILYHAQMAEWYFGNILTEILVQFEVNFITPMSDISSR